MSVKFSKTILNVIFSFILFWGIANFTGYIVINEFIKTDYFKNLIIRKLKLNNELDYKLDGSANVHWNPFAFGLVVRNFSFQNVFEGEDEGLKFADCKAKRADIKFNILQLTFGNLKPNEIYIKDSYCYINSDIFLKDSVGKEEKKMYKLLSGLKTINIRDTTFEFDKKKGFVESAILKIKGKNIYANVVYHDNFFENLVFNGEGKIFYDKYNIVNFGIEDFSAKLKEELFENFPKIENIDFRSIGGIELFLDDFLKFEKLDFFLKSIKSDILLKDNEGTRYIKDGQIVGSFVDSLKIDGVNLDVDDGKISGKGEFLTSEKRLNASLIFKNIMLNQITTFWPSNVGAKSKKYYESIVQDGTGDGKIDLSLKFSDQMNLLKKDSKMNLEGVVKNGAILCCENKFPMIKDLDGRINLDFNGIRASVSSAKIEKDIKIEKTAVDLNFKTDKLYVSGKAGSKVKNMIDLYQKDYSINIFGDDILKNVEGDATADIKLNVDLKNNKIENDISIQSSNISSFLEKNNSKIENGNLNIRIKNKDVKIGFKSKLNGEDFNLDGSYGSNGGKYRIKVDQDYASVKKIFDPIIGQLIKIDKKISGDIDMDQKKDNLSMKLNLNFDNAELVAPYLRLNKKVGEKARLTFNLSKNGDDITMKNFDFNIESEKKYKITVDNLSHHDNHIVVNRITMNDRNKVEKIEVNETKDERTVKVAGENVFYDDFNWLGFTGDNKDTMSKRILIYGESKKLSFYDNSFYSKVEFSISCEKGDCQKIALNNCRSSDKAKLNASIIDDKVTIATNDGGKLFNSINITNSVHGGRFYLDGYLNKYENGATLMENAVIMKNFRIKNTSIVAQILSLASLTGLLSVFSGKGIHFSQLNANFTFFENKVTFAKSVVEGQSIAMSFEGEVEPFNDKVNLKGSLIPFNLINMILRVIPVIGEVLVGVRGEGLFMIDFELHGALKHPNVKVNPMSFFTPYTIKKILRKNAVN